MTQNVVQVRPATVEDAQRIAHVHVETWRSAYAGIVPAGFLAALDPNARAERLRTALSNADNPLTTLVAAPAGEITGFVTFGPYRPHGDEPPDQTTGEVFAVYVHPDRQGLGAGRALMDAAVAELARRGATEIRLWVLEENARSRRFYERYGLLPDGARDTFRVEGSGGVPVDLPEIRYALRIGAGGQHHEQD